MSSQEIEQEIEVNDDANMTVQIPVKRGRGRPKIFSDEEQRLKRLAQQKAIREKRKEKQLKWQEETSQAQKDLVLILQEYVVHDEEIIELMQELVEMITGS